MAKEAGGAVVITTEFGAAMTGFKGGATIRTGRAAEVVTGVPDGAKVILVALGIEAGGS